MRCGDIAAPGSLLRTSPAAGEEEREREGGGGGERGRRGSKELREMEVKMAGADGAKIGPLFAF